MINFKKKQDRLGQQLKNISADLKLYFEKRIELIMLNTGESVSGWMAKFMLQGAGALLLLLGFCFLLVALAIYVGHLLESESLGYVSVGLMLLFSGILFLYLKPPGVFRKVKQHFEAEVIEAIEQSSKRAQQKIESAETKSSINSDE